MTPDSELLRRYAESDSEEAFAELVRRHLDLVYSAALRQVNGDTHLAQDIAQAVFTDLAHKAAILSRRQVLTGWLYTSTHFAAAKAVRTERRRQAREQEAQSMNELLQAPAAPDLEWETLRPLLDKMMHELSESDRDVILMRYFENRHLADIGNALSVSEDTARKRVDRALEKLRAMASKQGISASVTLGAVLSSHAVQMAPAGLAATLTSASLAGASASAGTGTTLSLLKAMTMTKLQTGIIAAVVAAGVLTPLVVQHRALATLLGQNVALRQTAAQMAQLAAENQSGSKSPAAAEAAKSPPSADYMELLRLRGEVGVQKNELGRLRMELAARANSPAAQALRSPPSTNYFPKTAWASAGNATPEAAIQSLNWAAGHNDIKAVLAMMSPSRQAEAAKYFAGKSDTEIAAELADESRQFAKTDGIRVINKEMISDDEVMLTYYIDGSDAFGQMGLKRTGNEWIIAEHHPTP